MAKVKLVKGKSIPTKRNIGRLILSAIPYINSLALIFLAWKVFNG